MRKLETQFCKEKSNLLLSDLLINIANSCVNHVVLDASSQLCALAWIRRFESALEIFGCMTQISDPMMMNPNVISFYGESFDCYFFQRNFANLSSAHLLKSLIKRRRAGVDILLD